jgi:hypothetical protein
VTGLGGSVLDYTDQSVVQSLQTVKMWREKRDADYLAEAGFADHGSAAGSVIQD